MAHFAELDEDNTVIRVIVVNNSDTENSDGVEDEAVGIAFCHKMLGGTWKQTSYNTRAGEHGLGGTPFRKNYCGKGWGYDEERDAFIPPKQFESWVLDEETCNWEAPVPLPEDASAEKLYNWDEETLSWVEF